MKMLEVYGDKVLGAIHGLDRVRFRGTDRWLSNDRGLKTFLSHAGILLKDFGRWVSGKTREVRQSSEDQAQALGIEVQYLRSSSVDKEALARSIAAEQGVKPDGSICMFSVVEPCWSAQVEGNRSEQKLEVHLRERKCVWLYHYWDDPEVGFGHVRIQSWLPFSVTICINGRHWLEKQMQAAGLAYVKDGNCFPWVEDMSVAQELLNAQLKTDWPALLNRLTRAACPILPDICAPDTLHHYWSADELEWATDVTFRSGEELQRMYPKLIHYGMQVSDSRSVMRYLGRTQAQASGDIRGRLPKDIFSTLERYYEGVRLKHWLNGNSIKIYNKSYNLLRIETTTNNTRDFKVFRPPNDDETKAPSWQRMRKGVCDLHRRCVVSDNANTRYGDTLCAAQLDQTLREVTAAACNPTEKDGRRYRGLNAWNDEDFKLLAFLGRGELAINGFRNKDLRHDLYPSTEEPGPIQRKRQSGAVSRRIRLLRAHGLVHKLPRVNRYVLSAKGQDFVKALLTVSTLETKALMEMAA